MKSILISIRKPHSDNIFDGTKIIEWRKTMLPLGHYYCYESGKYGKKKVIGEFDITCRNSYRLEELENRDEIVDSGKVEYDWLKEYAGNRTFLWANFISNAKLYDKPRELGEFLSLSKRCRAGCTEIDAMWMCPNCKMLSINRPITRPPQSWMYVEEEV